MKIVFALAGREPFVFDADFGCRFVLERVQGRPAEDAEVGIGMPLANAAFLSSPNVTSSCQCK